MIVTYVLGKRSYLSKNLKKNNSKFKLMSVKEMFVEVNDIGNKKINIIYNHSYPLSKLNNLNDYSMIISSNIYMIDELIKLLQKKKIKINSFIFTSSSSVYNINPKNIILQTSDNNRGIYAITKLIVERYLISKQKKIGFNLIIARIFNIFGPEDNNSLINKIIIFKKKKRKFKIYSKKKKFRDFIHIDDVVNIYNQLLNINRSGIFDIGSGKAINISNLINKFFKKKDQIFVNDKNFNEITFSQANLSKLNKLIGKIKFKNVDKFLIEKLN